MDINKEEGVKRFEKSRYMMATKAIHKTGDISSDDPDLCVVNSEDEEYYIGSWVTGFGFINVKFPKETTRELTEEEKDRYNGMLFQIGNNVPFVIEMKDNPIPKNAIKVTTRNSVYRFGPDTGDGARTVSRDENPLKFAQCKITFLAEGKSMMFDSVDMPGAIMTTSKVLSIE
jgi:hypothetical protein